MRTIKFRGKRLDTQEWVEGYYYSIVVDGKEYHYIIGDEAFGFVESFSGQQSLQGMAKVDPATVGQYTGRKDEDGAELFDGDIVTYCDGRTKYDTATPKGEACWPVVEVTWWERGQAWDFGMCFTGKPAELRKIGNRWDNPELLDA